jgi:sterol desaturase/sphingolipid hydroxylase (fatty acid hydroxylase superfamily)
MLGLSSRRIIRGLGTVNHERFSRHWPCAAAAGVIVVAAAYFAYEQHMALTAWSWVAGYVETRWNRGLSSTGIQFALITVLLILMEVFFLNWKQTTLFFAFVKRSGSTMADVVFTAAYFTTLNMVAAYIVTFGVAYGTVKLFDMATERIGWVRLELPTGSVWAIVVSFVIFYFVSTFIGYWQHRLMHWRWFWQLHRFHHATPDFNILSNFRANPAEAITVLPGMGTLFFLKVPDASLFATFLLFGQVVATFQHSQLPWSFGWFGRWLIASPMNHQVHHSVDPEHHHRNFSTVPLWDRMFGTYYAGSNRPSAYGIPGREHLDRPLTQWVIDIWIFYRDTARALVGFVRSAMDRARRRPSSRDALESTTSIPAE